MGKTCAAPLVSIIVPVFDGAATLERCLESVLQQTTEDWELLLVDDGSTDGSGEICDTFAERDDRIRVFHQENAGVSASRNRAIDIARGKYLQFLDSDDWMIPEASALLTGKAETQQCDLVVADFFRVVEDRLSHKGSIRKEGLLTREKFAAEMMERPADYYYGVLWNKLFRRDLVEEYALRMDPEVSWCEDFLFNLEYIRRVKSVYVLRQPIYYYVRTKNSLSSAGTNPVSILQMKRSVFKHYDDFYRDVFPKENGKAGLQVYRFLLAAAGDGKVPPAVLSHGRRLGEEQVHISAAALTGDALTSDLYRQRKLMDRQLCSVAFREDLDETETWLLYCVSRYPFPCLRREFADFTALSQRNLSSALQRLSQRGYFTISSVKTPGSRETVLDIVPQEALSDLEALFSEAEAQYREILFFGLSPEEKEQWCALTKKMRENADLFLAR